MHCLDRPCWLNWVAWKCHYAPLILPSVCNRKFHMQIWLLSPSVSRKEFFRCPFFFTATWASTLSFEINLTHAHFFRIYSFIQKWRAIASWGRYPVHCTVTSSWVNSEIRPYESQHGCPLHLKLTFRFIIRACKRSFKFDANKS